ncbi:MAG: DoxX family protein [Chitinophagaceae bacterium]|nr:DoxX family protein [Chitinophagaceae bacterium]
MKEITLIIRWIVGLLFIFSGLIKANDPLGLSYKMQEFFEAWHLQGFDEYTLALSLIMNVFEVMAGVAIIVGWQMRLFSWLLLLLIIFFSFLTGYAVLHPEKIKTCGCFGDCLPLTPKQSFLKDIALFILILIIFIERNRIITRISTVTARSILLVGFIAVCIFEWWVVTYLPVIDCLPYKKGNNLITEIRKDQTAKPDSFAINFRYKKNGKMIEFDQDHFPADMDSSYEFVDRYDKLIKKGDNRSAVSDFSLATLNGTDTTQAVLAGTKELWIMIRSFENINDWKNNAERIMGLAQKNGWSVLIITSAPDEALKQFPGSTILKCDATVMKTAARTNPVYILADKGTILEKVSNANNKKLLNLLDQPIVK